MRRPLTSASSAALLLSVLALLVAVAAFVRAGSSDVTTSQASDVGPVATQTAEPEPEPTEDEEVPTEEPTPFEEEPVEPLAVETPGDPLVPQTEYRVASDSVKLRVAQGDCDSWYVDVDAMRVTREPDGSEVQWRVCSDPLLSLQTSAVAEVMSPIVTPQECQEAIRTSPTNAQVKPSKGLVLCLISDGVGDPAAAEQQHITRLVVDAVNPDFSLGLTATTWAVG